MPVMPIARVKDIEEGIDFAVKVKGATGIQPLCIPPT